MQVLKGLSFINNHPPEDKARKKKKKTVQQQQQQEQQKQQQQQNKRRPGPDLDVPVPVQKHVPELEVSVDDLVSVQIARRLQDLEHVPPSLVLSETLCFANQLGQRLE